MEKFKQLVDKCKCGVFVSANEYRDYYQTIEDFIKEKVDAGRDIEPEVMSKMIEKNSSIEIQFYPDTPIGSHTVYHYDLDMALGEALGILEGE